jgi:hypothetical protein
MLLGPRAARGSSNRAEHRDRCETESLPRVRLVGAQNALTLRAAIISAQTLPSGCSSKQPSAIRVLFGRLLCPTRTIVGAPFSILLIEKNGGLRWLQKGPCS